MDEEERQEQLWSIAEEVWPHGTDFQREVTFHTYREMTELALAEKSFYAGFCLDETPDGRMTTASLLARLDPLDEPDAELSALSLFESLSVNENNSVEQIRVPTGPGVLVLSGLEWQSDPQDNTAPSLPLAQGACVLGSWDESAARGGVLTVPTQEGTALVDHVESKPRESEEPCPDAILSDRGPCLHPRCP
ncbi:hypothetical protein [Streptomyces blattellae]|uniref:hypothetical protein n=1 Tax=Streptomyces blattellae TaxID=2569855 RepID=UPI0012B8B78E|nr:hypothetical protein [Streptomyces blattellae]